jgi:ribosomal-protein-alanine N-acetyltransferase
MSLWQRWRARNVRFSSLDSHDADDVAAIHGRCFGRGWSSAEIEGLMLEPTVYVYGARAGSALTGMALVRVVAGEAEILTIATSPDWRGAGLGARLLAYSLDQAALKGALRCFLEVDADNAPAISMYTRQQFTEVGRRFGYYKHEGGGDALVLARDLGKTRPPVPPPDIASPANKRH